MKKNKVLIVVDMQNDFINGALGSKEAQSIVPSVKSKIEEYINDGQTVIFTRDTHTDGYLNTQEGKKLPVKHCIRDTEGWEIPVDIDISECKHIDKLTFGYIHWTSIPFETNTEFELIGLCTDICVISNAMILKAAFPETKITVDASCCAGVTPESHKNALSAMKMCQINIINEE
jgi:nicotinamidase-related amidase